MARFSRLRLTAAALAAGLVLRTSLASAQTADASQPSTAASIGALQQQIAALQAQVNKLAATQEAQQEAAEKQAVLDDAQKHSQLIPDGLLGSGFDPNTGFVIRSSDGAFSLRPGFNFDFRDMTSVRQRIPAGVPSPDADITGVTGNNTQSGFDVSRMRFILSGNYTKALDYYIQFQDDQGSTFGLYDAYGTLHLGQSPFSIKFGQFKDPVFHERLISDSALLAVDRTLLESFYGGGPTSRVQGAALVYDKDRLRAQIALHDGYNSINTKFFDSASASTPPLASTLDNIPPNFGTSGRVEYMVIGNRTPKFNPFTEYDGQFSAQGDRQNILVLGAAADYTQAGRNNLILHTVDAQFDSTSGLSLYGAYLGSYRSFPHANPASTTAAPNTSLTPLYNYGVATTAGNYYDPGFMLQAGYLVTPKFEPFVRYDYTLLANGSVLTAVTAASPVSEKAGPGINHSDVQEFTAGANYYLEGQHLKFTVDASYLPNGSPVDQDALGILTDNGHSEFVVRVQFQISI